MSATLRLSDKAIAVLRFRLKRYRTPFREERRPAFEELVAAGLMEPDGSGDYRFTEAGKAEGPEILREAELAILEREPHLPDRIELSGAARRQLRRHLAGDTEVTAANRPAYRELAAAGIMQPVSTFIGGPESLYKFTWRGWQRRHELHRPWPRLSASAIARRLSLAVSRIFRGVSTAR